MKTTHLILTLAIVLLISSAAFSAEQNIDWKSFSANLTKALKSDNEGLQQSAMCMVIQHSEYVTVPRDAVFEVVNVFRNEKDENTRLLALITLYKIEDSWAMDFLSRHRRFEKEDRIHQMCCCAVKTYHAKMDSIKSERTEKLLVQAEKDIVNEFYATAAQKLNIDQYGF